MGGLLFYKEDIMLQPITVLTENEISEYVGIELSKELVDQNATKRYIRDVSFLIENFIRSRVYNGDKIITDNQDVVKTAICYQIEYNKLNGDIHAYSLVDITKMQTGKVEDTNQWIIAPEVVNLLTTRGLLYRGIR
jgi:hypothetical protein